MKATITSYKESGKWYDTLDLELPDSTELFNRDSVKKEVERQAPQLRNFNYTIDIDDQKNWLKCLIINTK